MTTELKITLIPDANSKTGRHFVELLGGIYDMTVGSIVRVPTGADIWIIKGDEEGEDGQPREFYSPMAAALVCAAEYVEINEKADKTPSAHKIH